MIITSQGASDPLPWPGGYGTLIVAGDFAGNTVTAEGDYGLDAPNQWILQKDINGNAIEITASSAPNFLTSKCNLRLQVAGGSTEDINLKFSVRQLYVHVAQRY